MSNRTWSEADVRAALDEIARRATAANPGNDYTYVLQRYARPFDGANWVVTPVGRSLSPPGVFTRLEAELNAVRERMPIMDES